MWERIIEEIKKTEGTKFVDAFIGKHLVPVKEDFDEIIVSCPGEKIISLLEKFNYIEKINDISKDIFNPDIKVTFIVREETVEALPLIPMPEKKEKKRKKTSSTHLMEDYTFENFVPGPSNETAFKASESVSKKPGKNYNPLLIYGDTGLGKTHIIQAVGNFLKTKNKSVCYITSQQLLNDYIAALSSFSTVFLIFLSSSISLSIFEIDDKTVA